MKKVTVVGSLNIDHVLKVEKLPLKGETIISNNYNLYEGGKGSNQAASIGRLGISVDMIGKVGKDIYGERLIKNLSKSNVNVSGIIIDDTVSTGTTFITVDKNGNNTIVINPGANGKLTINDIESQKNKIISKDIILLQQEIPKDVISHVVNISKHYNKNIILNFAPAIDTSNDTLSKVDYLILNEIEIAQLTGVTAISKNINKAIKKLRNYYSNNIIITLGENGSIYIVNNDKIIKVPSYDVKSVDSTGAGDAFIGGFVLGLIEGRNIKECVMWGNAAGSITTTKLGAQSSFPDKEELFFFLKSKNINN